MDAANNHDDHDNDPCGAVLAALYAKTPQKAMELMTKGHPNWSDDERRLIWMGIFRYDGVQACLHAIQSLGWSDGLDVWKSFPIEKRVFLLPVFEDVLTSPPSRWMEKSKIYIGNYEIKNACMLLSAASLMGQDVQKILFSDDEKRKMFSAVANAWINSRSIDWIEQDPYVLMKGVIFQEQSSTDLFEQCWTQRMQEFSDDLYWDNALKEQLNSLQAAFQKNMIVVRAQLESQLNASSTRSKSRL